MLKELIIQNVILIEYAHIYFEKGFNVLSGETGSGKSAVIQALHLALGGRSEVGLIRHQADKASIEAIFDMQALPLLRSFLNERGIEVEDPSFLILKRELSSTGKSRSFINHQPVQLALLRQVGDHLVELVTQHANHKLFALEQHRILLDIFGNHLKALEDYQSIWQKSEISSKKLGELKEALPHRTREMETCHREIEEIEGASLKEGEEELLFQEYSFLSSTEERLRDVRELEPILAGERGILTLLMRAKPFFQSLFQKDPSLKPSLEILPSLTLEIEELIHTLRKYEGKLEGDPKRLEALNERLSLINRLKRKYGNNFDAIQKYLREKKSLLQALVKMEEDIAELEEESHELKMALQKKAEALSSLRKGTAAQLSAQMSEELHSLNMKEADIRIQIEKEPLNQNGSDRIEFFLKSNTGGSYFPLREGASGGEIARVLLAIHVLLAGREGIGTLIFDEIDANIGGTTAALIGSKLHALGKTLQIFSITHFPQVAKLADHHIQISKYEENGRTVARIDILSEQTRELELARMVGD